MIKYIEELVEGFYRAKAIPLAELDTKRIYFYISFNSKSGLDSIYKIKVELMSLPENTNSFYMFKVVDTPLDSFLMYPTTYMKDWVIINV